MDIMQPCWADEPSARPSFTDIAESLDRLVAIYERQETRTQSVQIPFTDNLRKNSSV